MNVHDLLAWSGPALDALVLIGLAVTWVQLRRDPTVAWHEYEERLRELQESLRLLVVQAEGEARDLDRRLAVHAEQLGGLADSPAGAPAKAARAQRDKPRVTDEERSYTPRGSDDEPRMTPLAAAMAATATSPTPPPLPSARRPEASLAERVQQLAAAQTPIAEIARRLSLPIAEARVLAGLTTGGLGFGPAPAPGARSDTTARAAAGRIAS
jgi:hypothetical protein